jgi:hypothetical protein
MPGAYAAVKGAALVALIREIRRRFLASPAVAAADPQSPNSLRLVALETFAAKGKPEKLEILGEIVDTDTDLPIERDASEIFADAGTAGPYIEDLVCEIACQVLYADRDVRMEDRRRVQLAAN